MLIPETTLKELYAPNEFPHNILITLGWEYSYTASVSGYVWKSPPNSLVSPLTTLTSAALLSEDAIGSRITKDTRCTN